MYSTKPTCRNCGGSEFFVRDVSLGGYTANILPVGLFGPRHIHLRICGGCGLLDWFVKPATLEKVKVKFSKET